MSNRSPLFLQLPVLLVVILFGSVYDAGGQSVDFQREVRPILADNCFRCHGPDPSTRQAQLRLDTEEGAFEMRRRGQAVVRGDAAASLIYQRITHDNEQMRMPPLSANKTLDSNQIEVLRRWIEDGALWDQHWSFKAVATTDAPAVSNNTWVRNLSLIHI